MKQAKFIESDEEMDEEEEASIEKKKQTKKVSDKNKRKRIVKSDSEEVSDEEPTPKKSRSKKQVDSKKMTLAEQIIQDAPPSKQARLDEKENYISEIGCIGGLPGDIFTQERKGEYQGLTIQLTGKQRPFLSNKHIVDAMKAVEENDFATAGKILWIDTVETKLLNHIELVYKVIAMWLNAFEFPVSVDYKEYLKAGKSSELDDVIQKWVKQKHSDPITTSFRIIGIGANETGSVVPEDWSGKEFSNANECHSEMNKLPNRQGKAPVCYCLTYNIRKQGNSDWKIVDNANAHFFSKQPHYVIGHLKNHPVLLKISVAQEWEEWKADTIKNNSNTRLKYSHSKESIVAVVTDLKSNDELKSKLQRESVSRWVSTLQKAIRRGEGNYDFVKEIVTEKLAYCTPYHLPEQQFMRVSAYRQMTWRLLITALEDCTPFLPSSSVPGEYATFSELFCLAMICNVDPDMILPFELVKKIGKTAQGITFCKTLCNWRAGSEDVKIKWITRDVKNEKVEIQNTLVAALQIMPMMSGDKKMITQYINLLAKNKVPLQELQFPNAKENPSNEKVKQETLVAGIDMHCYPNLILHIQSAIPCETMSTKEIGAYVWNNSSKLNVREKDTKRDTRIMEHITKIQKHYLQHLTLENVKHLAPVFDSNNAKEKESKSTQVANYETSRTAFLLLFGFPESIARSKKYPMMEVLLTGPTLDDAFVVKEKSKEQKHEMKIVTDEEQRKYAIGKYIELKSKAKDLPLPPAPPGFKWNFGDEDKKKVSVCVKSETEFIVDGHYTLKAFDASSLLTPIVIPKTTCSISDSLEEFIGNCIGGTEFEYNVFCRSNNTKEIQYVDWSSVCIKNKKVSFSVWKSILTQLHRTEIEIGPVDRTGSKVQHAISYTSEGYQWRIFNFLRFMYPHVLLLKGEWKFAVKKDEPGYFHLLEQVKTVMQHLSQSVFSKQLSSDKKNGSSSSPCVKVKLWDHQEKSASQIVDGFLKHGKRGFADASHVGAGKTLIALSIMARLYQHCGTSHGAFLVLVPNLQLIKTWQDEIKKHTQGFHVLVQQANGSLLPSEKIQPNTIIISSMSRCREHPLDYPWTLIIIDECLSVQNKEALQTEEAWRQSIISKFGVVMMSATFFRSRFDKLYYMLQMLQSHVPAKKEYLDILLSEHIICHIQSDNPRKWVTNTHKFELDQEIRTQYTRIAESPLKDAKDKYMQLSKLIREKVNYIDLYKQRLNDLCKEDENCKCLIYANSKEEADQISTSLPNTGRYPNIKKQHVVVSLVEGTYGLNDLVGFNTLLTRVPEPDKLPQMKGRLDRPGQDCLNLKLEMILLEKTIEEAWLFRMEMANFFYRKYIMPLAEFYEKAVEYK